MELDGDVDSIRTSVRRPVGRKVIRIPKVARWRMEAEVDQTGKTTQKPGRSLNIYYDFDPRTGNTE